VSGGAISATEDLCGIDVDLVPKLSKLVAQLQMSAALVFGCLVDLSDVPDRAVGCGLGLEDHSHGSKLHNILSRPKLAFPLPCPFLNPG